MITYANLNWTSIFIPSEHEDHEFGGHGHHGDHGFGHGFGDHGHEHDHDAFGSHHHGNGHHGSHGGGHDSWGKHSSKHKGKLVYQIL